MAKLHSIRIKNFRGFSDFSYKFAGTKFITLIGRGDSGKTTILDAISLVLSPSWTVSLCDTDFHNCNVDTPIEITATVYDLPKELLRESKYGLHLEAINSETYDIIPRDNIDDLAEAISGLTIRLIVDNALEPMWYVVNPVDNELINISASDRSRLNVFMIADSIDRHFSFSKGSPLFSLVRQAQGEYQNNTSLFLEALRTAQQSMDNTTLVELGDAKDLITQKASCMGVNLDALTTNFDFRDVVIKDGRISLHNNNIPLRLKGKGTKRLISAAIQLSLVNDQGIILIDELEQGLEPDRVQAFVRDLRTHHDAQIFITTHSRDAVVELNADEIYRTLPSGTGLYRFNEEHQGTIRTNPEALFARKVIVCEGATEVGIIRALDKYLTNKDGKGLSYYGVRYADGKGSQFVKYCTSFLDAAYSVCVFCDNDDIGVNGAKDDLKTRGAEIIDCNESHCIEQQLFADLPWEAVQTMIAYAKENGFDRVVANLKHVKEDYIEDLLNVDSAEIRTILGKASVRKNKPWYKTVTHGEELGEILMSYYNPDAKDCHIYNEISRLIEWISR